MITHRAGLLIPSSNTTVEHEYNRFGPEVLSWHAGRLTFTTLSRETLVAQDAEMLQEAHKLATARPDLMLICQSAVGFVLGPEHEHDLVRRVSDATGIRVLSLASLMAEALRVLGVSRVALVSPFPSGVDTATADYLAHAGYHVVRAATLNMTGNFALAAVPVQRLVDLVQEADGPDVEAVVIPGGNLRLLSVLDAMEAAIGKPVITTNQVGIWAASVTLGLPAPPLGQLTGLPFSALDLLCRGS